jgi:hypothetical protein
MWGVVDKLDKQDIVCHLPRDGKKSELQIVHSVRDDEQCSIPMYEGVKRTVDFTLDRQAFSISNGSYALPKALNTLSGVAGGSTHLPIAL